MQAVYLEQNHEGNLGIAPRGVRRIEDKALEELFNLTRKEGAGKHATPFQGTGQIRQEDCKPYVFGDPLANLNLLDTLKNTLTRQGQPRPALDVAEGDFVVYQAEQQTNCATVLLLDMSGSMARYGKFYHAKKVALALLGLVRARYPEDILKTVGFYTYASPLSERGLLQAAPKPVSLMEYPSNNRVFLRFPLDHPPAGVPEHFTNIHAGLRLARTILSRQTAANKQILCVTDGEPTAHLEGRELVLMYPPGRRTERATLEEVQACVRAGIQLSTFALIEDYFYLGLANFVDQMARTGRGLAIYCKAGELGGYMLDSFVRGRRARKRIS